MRKQLEALNLRKQEADAEAIFYEAGSGSTFETLLPVVPAVMFISNVAHVVSL